ncbi:MAG: hypothetical protein ACJ79U_10785 [Myxococcales bacterium]
MKALVLAGVTLMSAAAFAAAPYCAVYQSGRQCKYYTLQECRDAAGTAGVCVQNDKERPEQKKGSGNAPFCVVTRDESRCWYYDEQRCREAAASANAACVPKD